MMQIVTAKSASKSLRRKLERNSKLADFHAKVMESIEAKHVIIVDERTSKKCENLAKSYQLINVVY